MVPGGRNKILQPTESFEELVACFGLGMEGWGTSQEVIGLHPVEVIVCGGERRRVNDNEGGTVAMTGCMAFRKGDSNGQGYGNPGQLRDACLDAPPWLCRNVDPLNGATGAIAAACTTTIWPLSWQQQCTAGGVRAYSKLMVRLNCYKEEPALDG